MSLVSNKAAQHTMQPTAFRIGQRVAPVQVRVVQASLRREVCVAADAFISVLIHDVQIYYEIYDMWRHDVHFTLEQLGTIALPILVLDGDNDKASKPEHTEKMASLIPTATLHLIPATGHFAITEKAEAFNQVVLDYLSSQ